MNQHSPIDDRTPPRRPMPDDREIARFREGGSLDELTRFAAALCGTPIALVTLLDGEQQHFLGRTGTDLCGTPQAISFCAHALGGGVVEFTDLVSDPRFADNPLVTEGPQIRFYAGAAMVDDEGTALGTLCVLDTEAHPGGLTPLQRQGLAVLAQAALGRIDQRRTEREHSDAEARADRRIAEGEQRFRILADTMPQMVWSTRPDGYHDYYNARWYEFTGMPPGSTDGAEWNGMFHPDDQERAWTVWRHSLATGAPYDIEYRLRHADGTYRWVLGRALPMRDAGSGAIRRWFGTCTDIHEQKLAQDEREVISQELSHRIKNIFAVIAGLIGFAARSHPGFRPIADDLRGRITSLGRAHDFVRPHSASSRPDARQDSLHGLLADLFLPYADGNRPRVVVEGDDLSIDDRSATPMALLFHELATNASKYGALSVADGRVTLSIARGETMSTLIWREAGGPAVRSPDHQGFGSQLIDLSAVRQLGGSVVRDWPADGVVVTVAVPNASLSRRPPPAGRG